MLLECINTSVWNLFIIPEEDWSQSKSIEEYEVNKLKNEDGYSCFYAFVQLLHTRSNSLYTNWIDALFFTTWYLYSLVIHNPVHAPLVSIEFHFHNHFITFSISLYSSLITFFQLNNFCVLKTPVLLSITCLQYVIHLLHVT